jgi:MFS family permease
MATPTLAPLPQESEKITPYQWKVMYASVAGYIFDGMDSILFMLVLPLIVREWHLGPNTAGLMVTIFLMGQVVGGLSMGVLADYFGRKNTMIATILIYALSTGACALSPNWQVLAFFRFCTGFGTVGEWAAAATLIAETWPAKHRSKCASIMQSAWAPGAILGSVIVMLVAPHFGWRGVFFIGVLPAFVVLYIRRSIKETERFEQLVALRKEHKEKGIKSKETSFSVIQLFSEKRLVKHVAIGAALASADLIVQWGIAAFAPLYFVQVRHFSIIKSSAWFIIYNMGAWAGFTLFGPLSDKIGRKPTFWIYIWISAIFVPLFLLWSPNETLMCIMGAIAGFGSLGIYSGFTTYFPELFPTRLRATGCAFAPQLGRCVSVAGPWIIGLLSIRYGYGIAVSLGCLTWVWAMIALLFAPETRGKTLEEIVN